MGPGTTGLCKQLYVINHQTNGTVIFDVIEIS